MVIQTDFKELNDIYDHIEKNDIDYNNSSHIAKLFQQLRDLKRNEDQKDEAQKAQWETDFFSFTIWNGDLNPIFSGANEKGEKIEYPSLENFDDAAYDYLINRLNISKNPLIKARYSTILWSSPKKHGKYAKIATDSFLELTKSYVKKDKSEPQKDWGYKALLSIENAYRIGLKSKQNVNSLKSGIIRLINNFNSKSSSSFLLKSELMGLMLNEKKTFVKEDFLGLEKVCNDVYIDLIARNDFHSAIIILTLGEKIDNKIGCNTYNWKELIAETYESLMEKAIQNDNFLALKFCLNAIDNYKKIKSLKKIKELEQKYKTIQDNIEFKEIKFEFKGYDKHLVQIKKEVDEISKFNSSDIISYLMECNDFLLPSSEFLNNHADKITKDLPLLAMCSRVNFDPRGHPAESYVATDDKKHNEKLRYYNLYINFVTNLFLYFLFVESVQKEKLSAEIIINFLRKHSWIGVKFINKVNGKDVERDWIALIAPSLYSYFNELKINIINPKTPSNFILSMDSLVLKLEGLIRDFCRLNGITTFSSHTENNEPIAREKSINKLLNDEKLKEIISEEDLFFLRYLLIDQGGYNLRNEIAHSLISIEDYNLYPMNLLLLAFLRLAKYNFKEKMG